MDDNVLPVPSPTDPRIAEIRRELKDKLEVYAVAARNPLAGQRAIIQQQCLDFLADMFSALQQRLEQLERPSAHNYTDDPKHCHACALIAWTRSELRTRSAEQRLEQVTKERDALDEFFDACLCGECGGSGRTDNHVTGDVECSSCAGTGHDSRKAFQRAEAAEATIVSLKAELDGHLTTIAELCCRHVDITAERDKAIRDCQAMLHEQSKEILKVTKEREKARAVIRNLLGDLRPDGWGGFLDTFAVRNTMASARAVLASSEGTERQP
jgi:hypothetical protein